MNNKFFMRAAAAAMSLVISTLSMPFSAYAEDSHIVAQTPDGYDYELWNMNSEGETKMETDENGAFSCVWNDIENVLFRTGRNLGSVQSWKDYGNIKYEYDVEYAPEGNSYMCVYGWTKNPMVEYYIVDAWGDRRPPGKDKPLAEITVDGNDYEVYSLTIGNQMSIMGPAPIKQYWSVRKENAASAGGKGTIKGEISVSDHFEAWENAGLQIGDLYDVSFNIEGYKSSGEATVNKAKLYFGGSDSWKQTNVKTTGTETSTQTTTTTSDNTETTTTVPAVTTPPVEPDPEKDGFKDKFSRWFKIGTSASAFEIKSYGDFIKDNFSSITPENELKPEAILDMEASQKLGNNVDPQVNLKYADTILKFCEENGISLRGHTFVWYSQTPDWFFREDFKSNGALVSKEVMDQRLENFIKNTFAALKEQYPDLDIAAYDVCNELFVNDGGEMRPAGSTFSGGSRWAEIYGDDSFVINAFKYARKYAPVGCKLFLNDYNEYLPAKTKDICQMAMALKEEGLIDGIGMQSHLDTNFPDMKTYKDALDAFIDTGLEIQITELDITCTNYAEQADAYYDIFKLAMENAEQIETVTVWGLNDSLSWRSTMNPCLFWNGFKPKPAYEKILTLVDSFNGSENSVTPWGDANGDKNVDISDSVMIMQSIANPGKYTLDKIGNSFADVNLTGNGITNADALAIQKFLIRLVDSLPESYDSKEEAITTTAEETTTAKAATTVKSEITTSAETTTAQETSAKTTTAKETFVKTTTEETTSVPDTTTKIAVAKNNKTFNVGNGVAQYKGVDEDGYDYEIWVDQAMGGTGSMTLGNGGAFTSEWDVRNPQGSFISQSGKYFNGNKKAMDYSRLSFDYVVDFSAGEVGNAQFGIYGWLKDPLVEYYVIEDWKNWRPSNYANQTKTVVIDGAEYEIFCQYITGPCIVGNTQTFKRYYSVRKEPRKCGTVDLSKHFKAWENAGWDVGNLYQASLGVEAWESAGEINVKKLVLY